MGSGDQAGGFRDIGVAIGLPEPIRTEIATWREKLGDPAASRIIPHVTLLGPSALPADQMPAICEHLARVAARCRPFRIRLRGTGTFRPVSPVVFVSLATGVADCEAIQAKVRSGPLDRPLKFGYHPHVTVAHDIAEDALDRAFGRLADYDRTFDVTAFSLFERDAGEVWRSVQDFPFELPGPFEVPGPFEIPGASSVTDG